ncbi:MAG: LPS export ABC transporter periplasmic protein LptC [Alphaproteobacteria bacterium]|nr:LPS export ABC transporter periplasmic protein LptC [Alphaproteobacteria bacterium]MBQ9235681.1 LPS export ABC transporter periplasmic protein LptC [Alphaproteobacteria bacterium]
MQKIDDFFNADALGKMNKNVTQSKTQRAIVLAKVLLPITAAVLGLTLLILPTIKKDINEFAIDLAVKGGDIEKMNIENTVVYVTDAKGRVNNFTAENIRETKAGSRIYDLTQPEATLPADGEDWINIKSADGVFNQGENVLRLPSKVEVFYSKGMNIETRDFYYDFKEAKGYSKRPVVGEGFLGYLNAEGLEVSTADDVIAFVGKTAIIIDEKSLKEDAGQ